MKARKRFMRLAMFALTCFLSGMLAGMQKTAPGLSQRYQDWLNKDVAYIITPVERDVFLRLQTDKERDIFIEAFWKQRDQIPGTPLGGFKQEHYRRIAYANEYLGRETTRPGWQTDRGRMYILLGPPLDTVSIQGEGTVYPSLIWSYESKGQFGLPAHFNLLFYKKDGLGEYILYSPAQDGPSRLLVNYQGDMTNREDAYLRLQKYDSRLAEVSLSMVPDDSTFTGQVSLASEQLLSRINALPEKMVDSTYAQALLKFKDMVDVEYSANYIASEAMLKVFQDESGLFFLHYAIEPKRLSVLTGENSYGLNLILNGIITDPQNRTVFQYEKNIPLDFDKNQIEAIGKNSLVVQDMVPLIEGDFRFNLLMKNTVSKEFTSFEARISIPPDVEAALRMGPLLLGYQRKPVASTFAYNKPFTLGRDQIACQPENIFHPNETLTVAFQLFGLKPDLARTAQVRYAVLKEGREIVVKAKDLKDADRLNIMEDLTLADIPPGNYRLKVTVVDGERKELLAAQEDFGVSPLIALPRPWIVSKVMPSSNDIEYQYILGTQGMNINRLEEAERRLANAARGNSASQKYALAHAEVLMRMKDYQKAKESLRPFMERPEAGDRILSLMGAACQALGEYEEAISVYRKFLAQAGTSVPILNALGDCYYRQGNLKEALIVWERSLTLNPGQDSIQKLVDEIRRKK
ncbi:MAG: GWxTD domain-containing protein [Candidatus Aminicenantales bacterium]